jgi:hypothetical protein
VAGVAGAVAVATSGVATAATGPTITVKAIETSYHFQKDTPPKKVLNPGDKMLFTEKLMQNNKQVGTDKIIETFQKNDVLIDGIWTFTFGSKGTLHVHGLLTSSGTGSVSLPVVGGTGAFVGKKGALTVTSHDSYETEAFHLR